MRKFNQRRQLLKTAMAATVGALTLSQRAWSNTSALPAINALLLDEDPITCNPVSCSGFSVELQRLGQLDLILDLETPEGLKITHIGASATQAGNCDSWDLTGAAGQFGSLAIESDSVATTIDSGRYNVYVWSFQSGTRTIDITIRGCGSSNQRSSVFTLVATQRELVGYADIDSSGNISITTIAGNFVR